MSCVSSKMTSITKAAKKEVGVGVARWFMEEFGSLRKANEYSNIVQACGDALKEIGDCSFTDLVNEVVTCVGYKNIDQMEMKTIEGVFVFVPKGVPDYLVREYLKATLDGSPMVYDCCVSKGRRTQCPICLWKPGMASDCAACRGRQGGMTLAVARAGLPIYITDELADSLKLLPFANVERGVDGICRLWMEFDCAFFAFVNSQITVEDKISALGENRLALSEYADQILDGRGTKYTGQPGVESMRYLVNTEGARLGPTIFYRAMVKYAAGETVTALGWNAHDVKVSLGDQKSGVSGYHKDLASVARAASLELVNGSVSRKPALPCPGFRYLTSKVLLIAALPKLRSYLRVNSLELDKDGLIGVKVGGPLTAPLSVSVGWGEFADTEADGAMSAGDARSGTQRDMELLGVGSSEVAWSGSGATAVATSSAYRLPEWLVSDGTRSEWSVTYSEHEGVDCRVSSDGSTSSLPVLGERVLPVGHASGTVDPDLEVLLGLNSQPVVYVNRQDNLGDQMVETEAVSSIEEQMVFAEFNIRVAKVNESVFPPEVMSVPVAAEELDLVMNDYQFDQFDYCDGVMEHLMSLSSQFDFTRSLLGTDCILRLMKVLDPIRNHALALAQTGAMVDMSIKGLGGRAETMVFLRALIPDPVAVTRHEQLLCHVRYDVSAEFAEMFMRAINHYGMTATEGVAEELLLLRILPRHCAEKIFLKRRQIPVMNFVTNQQMRMELGMPRVLVDDVLGKLLEGNRRIAYLMLAWWGMHGVNRRRYHLTQVEEYEQLERSRAIVGQGEVSDTVDATVRLYQGKFVSHFCGKDLFASDCVEIFEAIERLHQVKLTNGVESEEFEEEIRSINSKECVLIE